MVRQSREQQYMARVWDSMGRVRTRAHDIAVSLRDYWAGVMSGGPLTEEECWRYVWSLPIPLMVAATLPLLVCEALVLMALEKLKGGSPPRRDEVTAEVYYPFPSVFSPNLLVAMVLFLREGGGARFLDGLLIPKFMGAGRTKDMRLLAL